MVIMKKISSLGLQCTCPCTPILFCHQFLDLKHEGHLFLYDFQSSGVKTARSRSDSARLSILFSQYEPPALSRFMHSILICPGEFLFLYAVTIRNDRKTDDNREPENRSDTAENQRSIWVGLCNEGRPAVKKLYSYQRW